MSNIIKIKRSTTSAAPASLQFGELAYSSGSGKLYFGSSTDGTTVSVFEIGGKAYTDLLSNVTAGTASASKAVVLDANRSISNLNSVTATSFTGALTGNVTGTVTDISNHTTTALAEGTNLYFTQTRARDSVGVAAGSSDALTYDSATGQFSFNNAELLNNLTTDNIAEGTNNKYFTQTRARDSISVTDAGGDGSMSYNAATGVITYTGPSASEVRAHFSAGTGVTITDGAVAIGQAVGTTDNVTFNSVTVNGTLTSDDITSTNISISGNAVITGNLTVQGTTTTVNSTTVSVSDLNITVAKDAANAAQADGAGLTVAGANATFTYTQADNRWNLNKDLNVAMVYGNVTGALTGNASTATALQTARDFSITGDVTATAVSFDGSGNVTLSTELAAGVVGTTELANDAVTSAKMAAGSVELATDTVTGVLPVANGGTGASTLDSGKLLIGAGTSAVTTDSGLAWNGTTDTLTVGGATIATDSATGDVTISTTGTNSDLKLLPNGTGSVVIQTDNVIFDSPGSSSSKIESGDTDSLSVIGNAGLTLESGSGDIIIELAGTTENKIRIASPAEPADYASGLSNNDIPNKYYVDQAILAALDGGEY